MANLFSNEKPINFIYNLSIIKGLKSHCKHYLKLDSELGLFSYQYLHRVPSGFSGRMGLHHVSRNRQSTSVARGSLLQHNDILPSLVSEKCFHCRHHGDFQRNPSTVPTNVGRQRSH